MNEMQNNKETEEHPPSENVKEVKKPPKKLSTKRLAVNLLIKIAAIAVALWLVLA